jgi:integrase
MPSAPLTAEAWRRANDKLAALSVPYRLREVRRSPFIAIRQLDPKTNKPIAQFTLQPLLVESLEDIAEALQRCLEAAQMGQWPGGSPAGTGAPRLTFGQVANRTLTDINRRLKASSSVHMRSHLRELAALGGNFTTERLKAWVLQVPPHQLSAYDKRLGTVAAIDRVLKTEPGLAAVFDLQALLKDLRNLKPVGGELKRIKSSRRKPKAIPSDQELQAWLDGLADPLLQWTFALIAAYGLRPSEAWHVLPIDADGWITVPGDQITKTATHVAPAVPMAWVERYRLRERFAAMQEALRQRWRIHWIDLGGRRVPNNNTSLSNYLYKEFQLRGLTKLWARAWEGEGQDWCRPYDLRHAYAVRCWSHAESRHIPMAEHAEWMGHGLELHRSTYLQWMTPEVRSAAAKARARQQAPQEAAQPALPPDVTPELLELARQLQRLQQGS